MRDNQIALRPVMKADATKIQGWLDAPGGEWLNYTDGGEGILEYYFRDEYGKREEQRAYIIVIGEVDAGIITINLENLNSEKRIDIDHFLIQESFRRRGYGSRALKCLLEMEIWPPRVVFRTEILPKNKESIQFFRKSGFVEVSIMPLRYERQR